MLDGVFQIPTAVAHQLHTDANPNLDKLSWVELSWLCNVTINDISVIYVTAYICTGGLKKKHPITLRPIVHFRCAMLFLVPSHR